MRLSVTTLSLLFFLAVGSLGAQSTKDVTVPLTASVNLTGPGIKLTWTNPEASNIVILRRTKGQAGNQWILAFSELMSTATTFTDNNVAIGQAYEYVIERESSILSYGYAHVAVRTPVVDNRGKILVFVDSTTADAIGVELVRMKNDMRGDGWIATPYKTGPHSTVQSVKSQIVAAYNADPQNVKAVLLIGDVPIPYSGDANWDGHPDHDGAWPADSYYGDINGIWTDVSINNTNPGRDANDNVPGDGKFDQSYLPSQIELQVGRIDFRHINAPAFGEANAIGLVRRYLDKNHAWRTGAFQVENKALVDDNFGYFGGEAFASDGYRNAYPLVGESNIVEADFFENTNPQSYLLGYGCGGGNYNGASGVGSSNNFAVDTVNIVFANLFGSYFGDWDYETNPFMPSALASRGGILTCSWAGRPHWFNQALASGETIGYCHKETQNAQYNNGFFGSLVGESGAHTELLGDPTLRAHIVPPPSNLTATKLCTSVKLTWGASAGAEGYLIYRSLSNDGPYSRITPMMVGDTVFVDSAPIQDTLFYQVRAIKTQTTPGGGIYLNNSVGPIVNVVFEPGQPPLAIANGGFLTCATTSLHLQAISDGPIASILWGGPNGYSSEEENPVVTAPGNYFVVITNNTGCTASASAFVSQNTVPPVFSIVSSGVITCEQPNATLSVSPATGLAAGSYNWSNGEMTPTIAASEAGVYEVSAVSSANGCTGSATFTLAIDTISPSLNLPTELSYNCINPCADLPLSDLNKFDYFINLEPVVGTSAVFCTEGIYSINVVSKSNGCSTAYDVTVVSDIAEPGASIGGQTVLSCQTTSVQLQGVSQESNVSYLWTGPGITPANQNMQNPQVSVVGVYTLVVTNLDNGCTSTDQIEITSDGSFPLISANGGAITCLNASVTLMGTSSLAGSTFHWSGPGGFSSSEQNPITTFPGEYVLVVTGPNACTASAIALVLDQTQPPQFTLPTIQQLNCSNGCVVVQIVPITPGLVIDPVTYCDPGTYSQTIVGPNGCSAVAIYDVTKAPDFVASLDPAFVDCDGSATITALASGGTPPYHYLWSNGSTLASAFFLLNGTPISVTVTDSGGCGWDSGPVNITLPPPINYVFQVTNELGVGASNGAIDITVSGGTPPFTYLWSNGATTEDISGISGGSYTVTVTEATTGCTSEISIVVQTMTVGTSNPDFVKMVSLSPNPTTGHTILSVSLSKVMSAKIEVRDATGRLVWESASSEMKDANYPIDLTGQPAGVYSVALIVDNQSIVRKLVLMH